MSSLRVGWKITELALKDAFAYRYSTVMSIILGPLSVLASYVIWNSVFSFTGVATIGGLTFHQMMQYYVITVALAYLTFDPIMMALPRDIKEGTLTLFLMKPVSYWYYEFMWKVGSRSLALWIEVLPMVLVSAFLVGWSVLEGHWFYFILAVLIAFVISLQIRALVAMSAFWLINANGIFWTFNTVSRFLTGSVLALSLYPPIVQTVFFLLPFQFMMYVPARLFIGNYSLAGFNLSPPLIILYGIGYVLVLAVLLAVVWRIAMRKYQGVGT